MKINEFITESWNPDKEYPDTEQGAIECFTDISEYKPTDVTKAYPDPYTKYVWAVHTNTKRYGPQKHVVWLQEKDFATDDRSGEEDFRVNESTTAGSVATVSSPLGKTQSRNASIYGGGKVGNLLTGKKTSKKYANSVNESKMKELAVDIRDMDNGNFQKKYKKSKEQMKASLGTPSSLTVNENTQMDLQTKKQLLKYADAFRFLEVIEKAGVKVAEVRPGGETTARFQVEINGRPHLLTMNKLTGLSEAKLDEEDKLVDPKKGHKRKTGLHGKEEEQRLSQFKAPFKSSGDFVSDSRGNSVCECDNEDLAKEVAKALTAYVRKDEGVIAGGGVGEAKKPKLVWQAKTVVFGKDGKPKISDVSFHSEGDAALVASNENGEAVITWDDGAKEYTLTVNGKGYPVPGPHKYPTQAKELGAKILAGVNEGSMTAKQPKGEKPWKPSMDRPKGEYDPIYGKAPRKGTVAYNAWKSKRDAALKGDLSEAQTMSGALKNTLAKAEPGSKLDNSIKKHNANIKAGYEGTLKNAPTGYHFDKKGYCRLGDK